MLQVLPSLLLALESRSRDAAMLRSMLVFLSLFLPYHYRLPPASQLQSLRGRSFFTKLTIFMPMSLAQKSRTAGPGAFTPTLYESQANFEFAPLKLYHSSLRSANASFYTLCEVLQSWRRELRSGIHSLVSWAASLGTKKPVDYVGARLPPSFLHSCVYSLTWMKYLFRPSLLTSSQFAQQLLLEDIYIWNLAHPSISAAPAGEQLPFCYEGEYWGTEDRPRLHYHMIAPGLGVADSCFQVYTLMSKQRRV